MAKSCIQKLRQRKDKEGNPIVKKCDICGEPLIVGEEYKSVWNYNNGWDMHIECYNKCPRSRWETSEYRGQVYDIQDSFDREDIDGLLSQLEDLKSEQEDKLENIPEQLRYGSAVQERFDALEDAISNIESLKDELEEIQNREYGDYTDEFDSEEEFEDNKESEIEDKISEIEDSLSEIDV